MNEFAKNNQELLRLIDEWEQKLLQLPEDLITRKRTPQSWSIKEIIGHLVDSASNNTHRIIHLQYQESPLKFPDYASFGNNDKWVEIQNYQDENWHDLVQLWKYSNIHIAHVIDNVSMEKLDNVWINALNKTISLRSMITNYVEHFKVHLKDIENLINSN
ncbi:MAG TPA: DinB family protein [Clostridiaceae bacterium]|nr:DinB family protein [Clostridiaceae bacterium]